MLLAEGASVQLPGHVASMTKPLLANQSSAQKHLPEWYLFIYLHFCRAFELLGGQELGLSNGSSPHHGDSNLSIGKP